jgi:ABC-type sugar transport system ATPase subunit
VTGVDSPSTESETAAGVPAAVSAAGIRKAFAGVQALRGVDFELAAGELHALVGENGAGKSTLAKIISGAYTADAGTLTVHGTLLASGHLRAHADAGIAMVYQEPKLVPHLTAAENVFLGKSPRRGPLVARREARERLLDVAGLVGIELDPDAKAGELTLAKQRMLDVVRALDSGARILIMDEPSAALGPVERESLYRTIERLREERVSIIFISHDLDEVSRLADRISVMRDGSLVARRPAAEWTPPAIVEAMLGRDFEIPSRRRDARAERAEEELLRVEGLEVVPGALQGVDLTLRRGEVLGVAGLVGSGRSTLLRALAGAEPRATGTLSLEGKRVPWPKSVGRALSYGIALAPEDRRRYGLVLGLTAALNASLTNTRAVASGAFVRRGKLFRYAAGLMRPLAFDPARLSAPAGLLSGGNQQKLVVGRTLGGGPRIVLLDEPTAGIDVGAKAEMFGIIDALAAQGLSVVFASSELEEVVEISDRILVLARGRSVAVLEGERCTVREILTLVFGVEREDDAA